MTQAEAGDARWRFLLTVSDRVWLEEQRCHEGRLWIGDTWGRHHPVRADAPVSCLPLLERPYATVMAELHEVVTASLETTRPPLDRTLARPLKNGLCRPDPADPSAR